jgi:hypothetical protein
MVAWRRRYGSRDIEQVPEPEANTRISKSLAAIAKGIAALNQRRQVSEQDLQDAFRVGIDCIPDYRRRLLLAIARGRDWQQLLIPRTVRDREIEEIEALQLITPNKELTGRTSTLLQTANIVFEGIKIAD